MEKYTLKFTYWADKFDKWVWQECIINDARNEKEALKISEQHISEFPAGRLLSLTKI